MNFGDRRLDVRGWHRVRYLRYLPRLTNVRCLGDLRPLDPLADIPHLTVLELWTNDVVRDLSPLARTTVDRLALHLVPATDLTTLAGTGLHALTIRDRRLDTGLHPTWRTSAPASSTPSGPRCRPAPTSASG